jgi:hypothetical protein
MKKLSDVLQSQSWHLGEAEPGTEAQAAINQGQLISDLKSVISNNETYFRICVALLVIIFLGCCALLYVYRTNTLAMTGLFTATGISFAALAPQMLSFWREKVRTDTVLILARQLPQGETLQMIQLLLANIGR